MKLSDIQIKALKPKTKQYKVSDGGGLFILIRTNGNKLWQLKYRFLGKEKTLSIGQYPLISLKEARDRRDDAKRLLANNQDPSEIKQLQKLELKADYENSFEEVAREWHEQNSHTWKDKHGENILKRLERNIFPIIGNRPIKNITPPELLKAVKGVEGKGHFDLAHRMLQICSKIIRYAVQTGRAENDFTHNLKGALAPVRSKNYDHLTETQLPEFLNKLESYESNFGGKRLTQLAFQLMIITFVRSGEIRGANWEEIDFDKKQWRIPEERMKMKSPHIIPLSKQAIKILKEMQGYTGNNIRRLVFPSFKNPVVPISENTFLRAIEVMGYKGITTAHGFRSTASTILNENQFGKDVIERQLAHAERDQVRAAYNYAEYLPKRAKMMQWYSDYIDKLRKK